MNEKTLPSLEQLIRAKIQRRIVAALALLIAGSVIITIAETALSYRDIITNLDRRAENLQNIIISELLVKNDGAIKQILDDTNRDNPEQTVKWLPPEDSKSLFVKPGVDWHIPGTWSFSRPLKKLGDQDFGTFIFSGNVFKSGGLVNTLTHRLALTVVICLVMAMLLLPIARKAPKELILGPVQQLLTLIRDDSSKNTAKNPAYAEMKSIQDDFDSLMNDRRKLEAQRLETAQLMKYKAIAATVQMLAHDVRKPFGIFQMGLSLLTKAKSQEETRTISTKLLPEIEKALSSVNGLISDVMMVGQKFTLNLEKTSLESIIESCLNESARIYPEAKIRYKYDLHHKHLLKVDSAKILRVFSNIVGNAIQAVNKQGEIWINSKETFHENSCFVEITLGNNGPSIIENDHSKIFEAFFTAGKIGGTGLGLEIAKEVVTTHGGRIWCESPVQGDTGVEFKFLLPTADELSHTTAILRPTLEEIKAAMTSMISQCESDDDNQNELGLEAEIINYSKQIGKTFSLGILDDEAVYRNCVLEIIARSPTLSAVLEIESFDQGMNLLLKDVTNMPDFLLCDIDLGSGSIDGFNVLEELRSRNYQGSICMHSNRTLPEDYRRAIDMGAQAFIPKPISREHLLKFIVTNLNRVKFSATAVGIKPLIIVLDDDIFFQFAWEQILSQDADVLTFDFPHLLKEKLEQNPGLLNRTFCIITDYYFGKNTVFDTELRDVISGYGFKGPVLLSSNMIGEINDPMITKKISKEPISFTELKKNF